MLTVFLGCELGLGKSLIGFIAKRLSLSVNRHVWLSWFLFFIYLEFIKNLEGDMISVKGIESTRSCRSSLVRW